MIDNDQIDFVNNNINVNNFDVASSIFNFDQVDNVIFQSHSNFDQFDNFDFQQRRLEFDHEYFINFSNFFYVSLSSFRIIDSTFLQSQFIFDQHNEFFQYLSSFFTQSKKHMSFFFESSITKRTRENSQLNKSSIEVLMNKSNSSNSRHEKMTLKKYKTRFSTQFFDLNVLIKLTFVQFNFVLSKINVFIKFAQFEFVQFNELVQFEFVHFNLSFDNDKFAQFESAQFNNAIFSELVQFDRFSFQTIINTLSRFTDFRRIKAKNMLFKSSTKSKLASLLSSSTTIISNSLTISIRQYLNQIFEFLQWINRIFRSIKNRQQLDKTTKAWNVFFDLVNEEKRHREDFWKSWT